MESNKGVLRMGDQWDYRIWKAELVWDLAARIIPPEPAKQGAWIEANYLAKTQEVLLSAQEVVNAVFVETKA